jgi:hypothetical protein
MQPYLLLSYADSLLAQLLHALSACFLLLFQLPFKRWSCPSSFVSSIWRICVLAFANGFRNIWSPRSRGDQNIEHQTCSISLSPAGQARRIVAMICTTRPGNSNKLFLATKGTPSKSNLSLLMQYHVAQVLRCINSLSNNT